MFRVLPSFSDLYKMRNLQVRTHNVYSFSDESTSSTNFIFCDESKTIFYYSDHKIWKHSIEEDEAQILSK